jgi:hypothetical protein
MASRQVDEVWHQFILFTKEYNGFCEDYLGSFMHHSPHISSTPSSRRKQGMENFINSYRKTFGDIPSIWNLSSDCSTDMCGADSCNACGNDCAKCD